MTWPFWTYLVGLMVLCHGLLCNALLFTHLWTRRLHRTMKQVGMMQGSQLGLGIGLLRVTGHGWVIGHRPQGQLIT